MSDADYIKQLEETIELLNKKLDEASYYKPVWCEEIVPNNGKCWVLHVQGNPVDTAKKKKLLGYKKGSSHDRNRRANAEISKETMCIVKFVSDGRCIPYIFGKEYEWQPNLEECKKYVNRIIFGVDEV
jgi:hypothetical protein